RALEQAGAQVTVVQADVAQYDDVVRLVASAPTPLCGVVHAAGVMTLAAVTELTLSSLETVLRPKVAGAWVLHQLTQDIPLGFFVMFSSIASVWGSRGQAHYAAANAFVDALAHYRRGLGLPALSINWGPWAAGGMTDADALRWLQQRGVAPFEPASAIAALR